MKTFLGIALASLFACAVAWAQVTAQIHGIVQDASGSTVPGAEVKATQTATGVSRTVVSGPDGGYLLTNLPIGPYQVEVSKEGFTKSVQSGIVLQVNSDPAIDVALKVGAVTEQIQVEANATQVETRNSSVGTVVENRQILELPLNGRAATDLIVLSGAAVSNGGEALSGRDVGGAPRLQVSGGSIFSVGYLLDGGSYYNYMAVASLPMPFPDALQEFRVQTTGVGTTDARAAEVSAVTRSGTNQLHGDVFEFLRNDLFNARQYFATTNSTLKRNQFGGTLGGRIIRDKLFFFGGYQQTIIRADPANLQAFVPTDAMLAGDWRAFTSPACAGTQLTLQAPFSGNQISASLLSKAAVNIVNKVRATAPPPSQCGLITYGSPTQENTWQPVARVDYQWTDKHSIFGRYTALHDFQPNGTEIVKNLLNSNVEGTNALVQAFTLGDTYLIGPNTINAFRISANRARAQQTGPQLFNPCDVGVNMYCGYVPTRTFISMTAGGGFNLGTGHVNGDQTWSNNLELRDDVSLVRGAHQFTFGGSIGLNRGVVYDNFYSSGRFVFNGSGATLPPLAQFMTGTASQLTQGAPFDYFVTRQLFPVLYASDTWKATQKLTVIAGVRWEPFLPAVLPAGTAHNFDIGRFQKGIRSTKYPNAPAGWLYAGDPGVPGNASGNNQWGHFAPRVGLAWDPKGDGKMSIRASFALSYAVVGGHWNEVPAQDPPFTSNVTVLGVNFENPWQTQPGGNPFPKTGAVFPPFAYSTSIPLDQKTPYTQSWNLVE